VKRILFVDDEPRMLDALRDRLRKQRARWDMVFCSNAAEALAAFDRAPFDIVVSDMRMPVLDGPELLEQIKARSPRTVRIILSGQADPAATLRAIDASHQFLSKPCEAHALRAVLERVCELDALLTTEQARDLAGSLDRLPPSPAIGAALVAAASRPGVSVSELSAIIVRDPALAAMVLRLVNSAYFELAQPVASIPDAVSYLGADSMVSLVRSSRAFADVDLVTSHGSAIETLRQHAELTARLASRISPGPNAASAFTAGLLHDVGLLVLFRFMPAEIDEVMRTAVATGQPIEVVEKQVLGFDHVGLGAYVLGLWGLPLEIVDAIATHRRPGTLQDPSSTVTSLHIANALLDPSDALDEEFVARVGASPQLARWRTEADVLCTSSASRWAIDRER